jgi:hypothetical protein
VLRVPNTSNHKLTDKTPPGPLLPVKLIRFEDGDFSVECIKKTLEPYKVETPGDAQSFLEDPSLFEPRPPVEDELSAGIEQHSLPPPKLEDLAAECLFVRGAIATGGAAYSQPLWVMTTLLATFTEGGRADAHRMANEHPGYSNESTDELFERKEREKAEKGIGWPSCKAISGFGCTACQACPNFVAGKSPFHFVSQTVPPATAPAHVASVTTAGNCTSDPLRFTSLPEHEAPAHQQ